MVGHVLFLLYLGMAASAASAQSEYSAEYVFGLAKNYHENIIGGRYEGFSSKNSWGLGIDYNFSSLSKGWAIYADYHYAPAFGLTGNSFAGIRTAFTFSKHNKGENYIVWTPSVQFGYHYTSQDFNKGGAITLYGALGYDVDLSSGKAKDVHKGAIFLPGITAGYRF
jgi:hypothetical protein